MSSMNKKLKLLQRLKDLGYTSEKKIKTFNIRQLIEQPDVKREDIILFYELTDAINSGSILPWIMNNDEEPVKTEDTSEA